MSKKFTIVAALVILAATVAGGVRSRASRRHAATLKSTAASAEKYEADKIEADYGEAISTVEERYVGEIDYEKATQAAIQGMLFTLDPHSVYFPATEFKKLKEDQSSSFYGIGVQILRHEDGVYVQSVVDSTPASRAGLRYGDRIVEVDGKDAREWSSEEVSKNVRGDRLKPVLVKVERAGEEVPHGLREIPQRLLLHRLTSSPKPPVLGASLRQLRGLLQIPGSLATRLPMLLLLHRQIPHIPRVPTMRQQCLLLLRSRQQPKPRHIRTVTTDTDIPSPSTPAPLGISFLGLKSRISSRKKPR